MVLNALAEDPANAASLERRTGLAPATVRGALLWLVGRGKVQIVEYRTVPGCKASPFYAAVSE
jgi:DNA-binding IclR family transcriptional regulator